MSELSIAQTGIGMESKSLVVFEHIHPVVICFFNGHATMYLYEGRAKNKREKVFCPILKINPFFLRCVGGTNFLFKFLEPSLYYYLHNNRDLQHTNPVRFITQNCTAVRAILKSNSENQN